MNQDSKLTNTIRRLRHIFPFPGYIEEGRGPEAKATNQRATPAGGDGEERSAKQAQELKNRFMEMEKHQEFQQQYQNLLEQLAADHGTV